MKNQNNLRTIAIVGSIWLGFMIVNSLMSSASVKTIPYSDFLRLAKEGKVAEVAVTDKIIQGRMFSETSSEQGERFQTVRVDSAVTDVLDQSEIE